MRCVPAAVPQAVPIGAAQQETKGVGLFEANFGLFGASANGCGVAFFAHVGGFVFGFIVASLLLKAGRLNLRSGDPRALRVPA